MTFNKDATAEIRKVASVSNDVIEEGIANNEYLFVIKHDKDNPTTFTVLSDPYLKDLSDEDDDEDEQYSLVGTKLTFVDPQDFIKLFPDLAKLPQVQLGPNQRRDENTGKVVGILPDEIEIKSIIPYDQSNDNPKRENPQMVVELVEPSKVGSLWVMWQHDRLDPMPYYITIATKGIDDNNKNFNIMPHLRNLPTNPHLQEGEFEIYSIPKPSSSTNSPDNSDNPTVSHILIQLNNTLTKPPLSTLLQIIKTMRVTRSKPANI